MSVWKVGLLNWIPIQRLSILFTFTLMLFKGRRKHECISSLSSPPTMDQINWTFWVFNGSQFRWRTTQNSKPWKRLLETTPLSYSRCHNNSQIVKKRNPCHEPILFPPQADVELFFLYLFVVWFFGIKFDVNLTSVKGCKFYLKLDKWKSFSFK